MYYKTDGWRGYVKQGNWTFYVVCPPRIPYAKHATIHVDVEDGSGVRHVLMCREWAKVHRCYRIVMRVNGFWRTTLERGKEGWIKEYVPDLDITRRYYSPRLARGTIWTSGRAFVGYASFNDRFKGILRSHGIGVDHTAWTDDDKVMLALAL